MERDNEGLKRRYSTIISDAMLPHTLRKVDVPYIHIEKSRAQNSRNHYRKILMATKYIYS
ncbi:hypothetical protein V1477_001434 [Vespula maculifrons]|uniref:Transposase n=1 Tax=Vespula maculifrons TaxID=7453 RepID=A0ABD2CZ89_VESMC